MHINFMNDMILNDNVIFYIYSISFIIIIIDINLYKCKKFKTTYHHLYIYNRIKPKILKILKF